MRYEDEIVGKDAPVGDGPGEDEPVKAKTRKIERGTAMRSSLLLLRDIGIAAAVLIVILQFYKPTIVFEHSMEDTLHPEDYVFLARQAYVFGEIESGDIVVFESKLLDDRGRQKSLIKRVIGLPGDIIEIKDGAVYRNGTELYEPFIKGDVTPGAMTAATVPEGSYFVLGDNRSVSMDSRAASVGFVPEGMIRGKVIFRLFPLSTAGVIR